jgi:hypothetical protein
VFRTTPHVVAAASLALFVACRPSLVNGVFRKDGMVYRLTPPSRDRWRAIDFNDNDLAFVAVDSPHMLAANSSCRQMEEASLETLTTHLLFGMTAQELVQRSVRVLDGRDALYSTYRAKLDGVLVDLEVVVVKKNSCVHDFTLVSPPGRLEEKQGDFEQLVSSFAQEAVKP